MTAALILFGVSAAVAQSAVTGKIVDETGAPDVYKRQEMHPCSTTTRPTGGG